MGGDNSCSSDKYLHNLKPVVRAVKLSVVVKRERISLFAIITYKSRINGESVQMQTRYI